MREKVLIRDDIFTEGMDGTTLLASRCKSCGKVFFPKLQFCANCFSVEMEDTPLSRRGTLFTFTITYMPSAHFEPPFANGYVDIVEGARVFAPLVIQEDKPFKIGMEMELVVDTLWREGEKEIVGYKFRPV